jgi:hypothetical protein
MRLALSSAAAPDATLGELAAAARRRGLRALELQAGHGHGLLADASPVPEAAQLLRGQGIEAVVLHSGEPDRVKAAIAALGGLVVTVVVPAGCERAGPGRPGVSTAAEFEDPAELLGAATHGATTSFSWTVRPGACELESAAAIVIRSLAGRLRHVRLHGGGPEASAQEGQGVGALMRELALAGFEGTLALAPSSPRYRVVWATWLGRRGGWGCGSKTSAGPALPTAKLEGK